MKSTFTKLMASVFGAIFLFVPLFVAAEEVEDHYIEIYFEAEPSTIYSDRDVETIEACFGEEFLNNTLSGIYTYDANRIGIEAVTPNVLDYFQDTSAYGANVNVGDLELSSMVTEPVPPGEESGYLISIEDQEEDGPLSDGYSIRFVAEQSIESVDISIPSLVFSEAAGYPLVSTELPTVPPTELGDWGIQRFKFALQECEGVPRFVRILMFWNVTTMEKVINAPPVADAGGPYSGQTNIGIALDGSGSSDADGDPLTYSWAVDSVNCSFDDSTLISPVLTCTAGGSYAVTLTVDDGEFNDSDSAAVDVNTPPVADAGGPYSGLPNIGIALDGSGSSDADGDPLTYSWAVYSINCSFDDSTLISPVLTCTAAGDYAVTLTVDDGEVDTNDNVTVTVITQQEAIGDELDKLQTLVDDGILKPSQVNGLSRPLVNAIRSLDKDKIAAACSQLQDYIYEVNAKTPTPLDPATAAELIADAETIRTSLSCI